MRLPSPAIFVVILLTLMRSVASAAAEDTKPATATSLCTSDETILFSCDIGAKKVSLCGKNRGNDLPFLMQYRFGKKGSLPELVYPTNPSEPFSKFSFGTAYGGQLISFSRPGADYDILTADKVDKKEVVSDDFFTGLVVTVPKQLPKFLDCEQGSVSADLAPLQKALGLKAEAPLSDTLPKYPEYKNPFPILREQKPCGSNCTCELEYPKITDSAIAEVIKSFISQEDCGSDYETSKSVSANVVNGTYLTLSLNLAEYAETMAHYNYPVDNRTVLFHKGPRGWERLAKEGLFKSSQVCRERVERLLYRQLVPQFESRLSDIQSLFNLAQIEIGSQGLIFYYGFYVLAPYGYGAQSVLIPFKTLDGCLSEQSGLQDLVTAKHPPNRK